MSDSTHLHQPRVYDEDFRNVWRERGLSDALLDRAAAVRIPQSELERMAIWWSPEQAELYVGWCERSTDGPMRWRQAVESDNEEFCDLWANAPEEVGAWDITVERGPNGFAQFELQERPVLSVLYDRSVMVACVSFAIHNAIVGGQELSLRFGQALRVRKEFRRGGYGNWVRTVPWPVGIARPTHAQYDYIRSHNETVVAWLRRYSPGLINPVPERKDDVPGIPVTVLQYRAEDLAVDMSGIRSARPNDLERCVELINGTHAGLDLYRPRTVEFLANRLNEGYWGERHPNARHVYDWSDFFVVEDAGRVVACGGMWDKGRDARERWRHRETGEENVISNAMLIDFGFEPGRGDAMARLIESFIVRARAAGRTSLVAPLEWLPDVAALLADRDPTPETRALQWRMKERPITRAYTDLVYW